MIFFWASSWRPTALVGAITAAPGNDEPSHIPPDSKPTVFILRGAVVVCVFVFFLVGNMAERDV